MANTEPETKAPKKLLADLMAEVGALQKQQSRLVKAWWKAVPGLAAIGTEMARPTALAVEAMILVAQGVTKCTAFTADTIAAIVPVLPEVAKLIREAQDKRGAFKPEDMA